MSRGRPGIALLNMGSPSSASETRAFLFRLFSDPALFRFPGGKFSRTLFAALISSLRAPRVHGRYRILGGVSPLLDITRKQASALEAALSGRGLEVPVEVCMRYSRPFAEEATERLLARGADRILGVPLYPQYSMSTTGSSLRALQVAVSKLAPHTNCENLPYWYDDPGYLEALAGRILACRGKIREQGRSGLLFLAHSIPVRYVQEGDPYVDQVQGTVEGVLREIKKHDSKTRPWFLAYQGQVGPVPWVGPPVRQVVRRMVDEGIVEAVVVPVSFVSDHLETLYEIDLQYRRLALEMGMITFQRIESLNDGQDFIRALADLIVRRINKMQNGQDLVGTDSPGAGGTMGRTGIERQP